MQQEHHRQMQQQEHAQNRYRSPPQLDGEEKHDAARRPVSGSAASAAAPRPSSALPSRGSSSHQHGSFDRHPPAPPPLSPGPVPVRPWDDDFTATIRRSAASALSPPAESSAASPFEAGFDDEIDVARAIASRHALQDQFDAADRYQRRAPAHAASSSSPAASSAVPPHSSRSSAPACRGGSFSGRSTYDLAGVLRARDAQRDRLAAQQMAQQEREDAIEHAQQMEAAHAAMQPFEVTAEWRRRWAHTSHTSQCGVCLDSFQLRALVTQLPCAHTFHTRSCLAPWLERQSVCPMCRFDLKQMCPSSRAIKPQGDDEPFSL